METITATVITGIVATALMDAWALLRRQLLGTALPNYALVGRWIAHMPRGRIRHASIAAAEPVRGEGVIGWLAHYFIGIAFAGLLPAEASLWSALLVGVVTVAAPFFIMQPAMGAGIAASRTPRPAAARVQSLITHSVFGLGLYVGSLAASLLTT